MLTDAASWAEKPKPKKSAEPPRKSNTQSLLAQDTQQKLVQAVQDFSAGCKSGMEEFHSQAGQLAQQKATRESCLVTIMMQAGKGSF